MGRWLTRLALLTTVLTAILVGAGATAEVGTEPVRLPVRIDLATPGETVVVKPGDHLWKITEHYLERALQHEVSDDEVSPLWRAVIEANRPTLRSGDPDLIYPGELVTIPADSG